MVKHGMSSEQAAKAQDGTVPGSATHWYRGKSATFTAAEVARGDAKDWLAAQQKEERAKK